MGLESRSWPMLALLLALVLTAVLCLLWFLGEATRNERAAIREKLAVAYRGHLVLVRSQMIERWNRNLAELDGEDPARMQFARIVREGVAESAVCLDREGAVVYPDRGRFAEPPPDNSPVLEQARLLAKDGDAKALARLVLEMFPDGETDDQTTRLAASVELLALESLPDHQDADFRRIAERLGNRVLDYGSEALSSARRRFFLRSLQQWDIGTPFLTAEDLAEKFLEAKATIPSDGVLQSSEVQGVWVCASPQRSAVGLFTTEWLRNKLAEMARDAPLPSGVHLAAAAPGEEYDSALASVPAGDELPGWRLVLSIDDEALFDAESEKRVQFLVVVAGLVIGGISVLSLLIARSFGRQIMLASLKNDLVATVSHELKTPLTAMRALVDTLLDSEQLDAKTTREYLHLIAAENLRLSRLIQNFLTFSRIERNKFSYEFQELRAGDLVDAAVRAFGERAHAPGCTLDVRVEEPLPQISGDCDALATALLNLLENAWKYSGDQKHIVIAASCQGRLVRFDVEDNGIGLSAQECRLVFQRFYQSDQRLARTSGGCGLGLSIVKSIVSAHHGSVRVTSKPAHGSTFTIEIPAIAGQQP